MLLIILNVIFSLSHSLHPPVFFPFNIAFTSGYHSGVATLSITDSSATSSEDASNPDSPDNSNVVNNDLLHRLNGSRCSKQNQQVPTNNNNSNHNKNEQVRTLFECIKLRLFVSFHSFCVHCQFPCVVCILNELVCV